MLRLYFFELHCFRKDIALWEIWNQLQRVNQAGVGILQSFHFARKISASSTYIHNEPKGIKYLQTGFS